MNRKKKSRHIQTTTSELETSEPEPGKWYKSVNLY